MPPSFRGADFVLNFSQTETRIAHGDHDFCPMGIKCGNLIEDLPWMLSVKFLWRPCLLTNWDQMSNIYIHVEPSFHGCFLTSFSSFDRVVSKEKIQMWKVMTDNVRQVMTKAHMAYGKSELTSKCGCLILIRL